MTGPILNDNTDSQCGKVSLTKGAFCKKICILTYVAILLVMNEELIHCGPGVIVNVEYRSVLGALSCCTFAVYRFFPDKGALLS